MKISINGKDIGFTLDKENNVGEILGALESECEKNGMTITSIAVNGEIVSPERLDDLFTSPIESIQSIDLETMSGDDVVDVLHRIGNRMNGHVATLSEIPVLLQTGEDSRVIETIHNFAQDFEVLCQSLPLMNTIGKPAILSIPVEDTPLEQYPTQLTPLLGELIEAIKANDTVLVGDISEYELAPKIKALSEVLTAV